MESFARNRNKFYLTIMFAVLIFLAYYPLINCEFLNYDDPFYITANSQVTSGLSVDSIKWAFTSFYFYNWHPLTWISHMLDFQLFGLNAGWHHFVSLLFHICNSILLFLLLREMTGSFWKSLAVAALFALHPLHVQSVAWVSERKDVLSTFFWFLTMIAYTYYARKPHLLRYLLCVFLFCCGLMAKPMLVTVPFVLLLLDFWPLGRAVPGFTGDDDGNPVKCRTLVKLFVEKIPFLILAVASSIVTFLAQKRGGAVHFENALSVDMANGIVNYLRYALKMVWPLKLSVYYPYDPSISHWTAIAALLAIIAFSIAVIAVAKRFPYLPVGWLWYLGTFLPVIGFLRIGEQAMADRYTYIPLIGLFVIIVWGCSDLAARLEFPGYILAVVLVFVLSVCATLTNLQVRKWHDSVTLFTDAILATDNNWIAHKNLAAALANRGDLTGALYHVSESLRIRPEPLEYVSQGWLYLQLESFAEAVNACNRALEMAPNNEKAHFIRGTALAMMKDFHGAAAEIDFLRGIKSHYADRLLLHMESAGYGKP
jgi:protein O-mannosyl-transferase